MSQGPCRPEERSRLIRSRVRDVDGGDVGAVDDARAVAAGVVVAGVVPGGPGVPEAAAATATKYMVHSLLF